MLDRTAEANFREGTRLLDEGRHRDALPYFSAALESNRVAGRIESGEARYLSYYGLCLCLTRTHLHEALSCCRAAARKESFDPDICWHLGRVALAVGRRGEAFRALRRGLAMQPDHAGIRHELKRLGRRRPPVVRLLSRAHPVNVLLGRARARFEQRWPDGLGSPVLGTERHAGASRRVASSAVRR